MCRSSSLSFFQILYAVLPLLLAFSAALVSTQLPEDEVEALKDIAKTLGKTDWNFTVDPCGGTHGWVDPIPVEGSESAVTCNCSLVGNSSVCHVFSIVLKSQNLPGKLPPELIRLPYLQEINLARNYLSGTIPPQWGALRLVNISLGGNRLTGSLPVELANITSLKALTLNYNIFSGVLPAELGNMQNLKRLLLISNNFTGKLPETFSQLISLNHFRISDNSFSGKIPDFIQNWTNLSTLAIQASGLTGPIPSGISVLTDLTEVRITDLNGPEIRFPPLEKLIRLKILMLRNCNISGELPEYLAEMKKLRSLDLSFNKLTGKVPKSLGLIYPDYIFLTGNMLTGSMPLWLQGKNIDLSYNNFTNDPTKVDCQHENFNLFASSSGGNTSSVSCLNTAKCPENLTYIHINCGGNIAYVGENYTWHKEATYDEDTYPSGPSEFHKSNKNWASSNTGYFADDSRPLDSYTMNPDILIASTDISQISTTNPLLYMNARLSPISLTYYGFCMRNGNYTVNLHFAEIFFENNQTYGSLGKRIFDIYLQGSLVKKDFNIADEAGWFGKPVVKHFNVSITSNTLEIRLFWAGKGTTGIPRRGIYGPLISAISVHSNFDPSAVIDPSVVISAANGGGIAVGIVIGIVTGGIFIILLIIGILWWNGFLRRERTLEQDLSGVDLQTSKFTLRQIKAATNNFDPSNKIGEGGFGPVHKGVLSDGTIIAVKQLSAKSKQGNREFVNEIGMISALQHPHLVKLYGCCIDGNQLLLVYEYMENNSLARALFGREENQLKLNWQTRHTICVGIAKGLTFLHEESRLKIVHRDIKTSNVLLTKNLFPKISDFGLAKLDEDDNTHISTRIAGTLGYMAPEYALRGYLTDKADVYSFGIVVLEIVSGRSNTTYLAEHESFYLLDWALSLKQKGNLLELVDPRLGSHFNKNQMMITINVALLCTNVTAAERPMMSSVVSMLEGKASVPELVLDPNASKDELEKMREHFLSLAENLSENSQRQTALTVTPLISSSTSVGDLYPLNSESSYYENRNWSH